MGERLRRRILSWVLFVFIRGSNSQQLDIRAGGFGFFDRMIDDRMMEKWIGCSAAMGEAAFSVLPRKPGAFKEQQRTRPTEFLKPRIEEFSRMRNGFAGEFDRRSYSCSFGKFVVQMCRVWTSGQDEPTRFPSRSGFLKFGSGEDAEPSGSRCALPRRRLL